MLKEALLLAALALAVCIARSTEQLTEDQHHADEDHREEGRDHHDHLPGDHHGHSAEDHLERYLIVLLLTSPQP